jgi:ABC-type antimicrobial peptide transport system permease subunit
VIVNDVFVKRYMPNDDPLTRQILPWTDKPARIVGVVKSIRQVSLDQEPRPELYVAAAQSPGNLFEVIYAVSTTSTPEAIIPSVRKTVAAMAPDQPLFLVQSMESIIADSLQTRKLMLTLLAVFAGLAVFLSAAGVYGVMSYGVAQRTREIGIRMALGARGPDVLRMILGDAGKVAGIGVVFGLAAAFATTRIMQSMLYGIGPRDPGTFATVSVVIAGTALLASLVPATRAMKVDPVNAIKT